MGQRILLSCDNCGYKEEMSVGSGLMSNNPAIIASCLKEGEAAEWRRLHDGQKIDFFRAEQKAVYCEHCNEISCSFTVKAELKDGEEMMFGNKCEKCGNELREISLEAHHMVCPVCGTGDLSWKQVGFWD